MRRNPQPAAAVAVGEVVILLAAACGGGRDFRYACPSGQADGYGACIPDRRAPRAVEEAATSAFVGEAVDSLGCVNAYEFSFEQRHVRLWRCRRVVDGRVITDGRVVYFAAAAGRPVPDADSQRCHAEN